MQSVRRALVLTLATMLPAIACAEATYITIPGERWTLRLETPAITSSEIKVKSRRVRYIGSSIETGITVSLHGEIKGAGSNQDCFDTFWPKAQTNPVLLQGTVSTHSNGQAHYATHQSEGEYKGQSFKTANGHAYFARNGLCFDLHVSHWPFREGSEALVNSILKSIHIVE